MIFKNAGYAGLRLQQRGPACMAAREQRSRATTHLPSAMFLLEIGTTLGVGQHPDLRAPTLEQ